jgi:hypothetical protein
LRILKKTLRWGTFDVANSSKWTTLLVGLGQLIPKDLSPWVLTGVSGVT